MLKEFKQTLTDLGLSYDAIASDSKHAKQIAVKTPINGQTLLTLREHNLAENMVFLKGASRAVEVWRKVPAPKRGELIRIFGNVLRKNKEPLGKLITIESGKILQEGLGEVQEMIDICDFAVGQSRQLYGLTIASERANHKLLENWHPLGPVAVISAFNFPAAVWAWNAALAIVCGNPVIWKPSEKTPVTALACQKLFCDAATQFSSEQNLELPAHLSQVVIGGPEVGKAIVESSEIKLVSATGSTRMGEAVARSTSHNFKRTLLELGGNNAMIVTPSADLDQALESIVFGAVGTAGQRCTTLRRLIIHEDVYDDLVNKIKHQFFSKIYNRVGNPLEGSTLLGPLIDKEAYENMLKALLAAQEQGGVVAGGARDLNTGGGDAFYVLPSLVEMPEQTAIVKEETFAPILYVMKYRSFKDALRTHNDVPQGLSSSIFTTDMREAEEFLAESDCGIANVNIGTSGAEIGGAFGGEKATGGGRESGTDSWKNYMRRQTNTVNYAKGKIPLAQGVEFD